MKRIFFHKPAPEFDEQLQRVCKSCSNEFTGRYCNRCGEKVLEPHERSIKFFLSSVFNAFTFIEGKFWNTLKTIFSNPGKYSSEFATGIRQRYMRPIAFFFVANVIYFLFPLFINTFATPLKNQRSMKFYGAYANELIVKRLVQEKESEEDFETRYNNQAVNLTKSLLVLVIPIFSGFIWLANLQSHKYFSDHILFSAEFNAFMLFCNMIILPILIVALTYVIHLFGRSFPDVNDDFLLPIISTTSLYFLIRGEMEFYEQKWWRAILKGILLYLLFFITLMLYRFILFLMTLWTI